MPTLARMDPIPALVATFALVAVSLGAGWWWRARTGRLRPTPAPVSDLPRLLAHAGRGSAGGPPLRGAHATLVQLSSDLCSTCGPARRILSQWAQDHPGVVHVEVDLTAHPELAGEFRLLSTPTTIIFDGHGHERGRIVGAPRKAVLRERLSHLLEPAHAVNS